MKKSSLLSILFCSLLLVSCRSNVQEQPSNPPPQVQASSSSQEAVAFVEVETEPVEEKEVDVLEDFPEAPDDLDTNVDAAKDTKEPEIPNPKSQDTNAESKSDALFVPEGINIPILVYHHIREHQGWSKSTWSWKMSVSPSVFDVHMQWLRDRGYTTISMDTLVKIINGEIQGPLKPVVITFDDNQLNSYEHGFPILKKHGHMAVFYLVSNRLDNASFIGRSHIPELMAAGMDIQSHTATHANMTKLTPAEILWQLRKSKEVLEAVTGKPVRHVAYPLTAQNTTVRNQLPAAGYVTGTIMDPRPVRAGANLLKLPRIMMTDDTNLEKVLP